MEDVDTYVTLRMRVDEARKMRECVGFALSRKHANTAKDTSKALENLYAELTTGLEWAHDYHRKVVTCEIDFSDEVVSALWVVLFLYDKEVTE